MIMGLYLQDYLAQDYNNAFVIIILTLYDTLLDYVHRLSQMQIMQ